MRASFFVVLTIAVVGLVTAFSSLFIVNPTQQALVLQFGEVRQAIREPGLNFKIPLVQDVQYLDKRILDLNVPAQEIIASDQKRLVVDAFMRYRIANPVRFYQTVNNVRVGASRLNTFVQSTLRAVLADATFQDIVRDDRQSLMRRISQDVSARARGLGVEVVDVKIRRADLPAANSQAIFRRMETEREQEAAQIRAEGEEAARRIRAAADRQATVLRAEAQRESEQVRGQGDAQKSAIFANAFERDPQFFAFYRAMQAYEAGLQSRDTRLVLSPDAEFFRFFNDPMGTIALDPTDASQPTPAATTPSELPQIGPGAPEAPALDAPTLPGEGDSEAEATDDQAAATPEPAAPATDTAADTGTAPATDTAEAPATPAAPAEADDAPAESDAAATPEATPDAAEDEATEERADAPASNGDTPRLAAGETPAAPAAN
ncbi:MAG: protease modulator HflC [Pseudomonadota bacterium]